MQTTFETEGNISSALHGSCPNSHIKPGVSANFTSQERMLRTMDTAFYRYKIPGTVFCILRLLNNQLLAVGIIFLLWKTPCDTTWAIRLIVGYRDNENNRPRVAEILHV